MMRSVLTKTLYDRRWFILGWAIAFMALTALLASFFPAMKLSGLEELVKNMPPAFTGLIGDLGLLSAFDTYMASQLFDIRLPLISGIMAIILGLGLSSNEEEAGELRTTLALPVSRTKVLLHKWLAIVSIAFVMVLAIAAGIFVVQPFIDGAALTLAEVAPLLGVSWLLMVAFGTIPFAAGMVSGRREVAMAAGVIVVIGSFILTTFGQAVEWLADFEKLSLLYYFPANDIMRNGVHWPDAAVLGSITAGLLLLSLAVFRTRDVH